MTNLYPIRNGIFPGTRLHIFEKDSDQVKDVLDENQVEGYIKCPNCGSHDYEPYLSKWERFSFLFAGIFGMLFSSKPHVAYKCNNCHHTYAPS
jgi:DNA-directed RNA polymerase subunit RPC12/RpoP